MISKNLALALALASAASAAPSLKVRDDCQNTYKACVDAGTPEVVCSCDLTACLGEDAARIREWCFSQTASLKPATSTAQPTFTSIPGIPGGCNPAHPGSCPSSYFTQTTASATAAPTFTSIPGIPGGCNPAHPGSCPDSYFTYPTLTATQPAAPAQPTEAAPAPPADGIVYPDPVPVAGKTWTVENLTRYCGEDGSGCDYNFAVNTGGDSVEHCTVIRMPGADAAIESWYDEPCTSGSKFKISWGYATEPAPAFAVMTVVEDGKELAWFGVANVNEQPVTTEPSSPYGSGQYGTLGPQQVYTY